MTMETIKNFIDDGREVMRDAIGSFSKQVAYRLVELGGKGGQSYVEKQRYPSELNYDGWATAFEKRFAAIGLANKQGAEILWHRINKLWGLIVEFHTGTPPYLSEARKAKLFDLFIAEANLSKEFAV